MQTAKSGNPADKNTVDVSVWRLPVADLVGALFSASDVVDVANGRTLEESRVCALDIEYALTDEGAAPGWLDPLCGCWLPINAKDHGNRLMFEVPDECGDVYAALEALALPCLAVIEADGRAQLVVDFGECGADVLIQRGGVVRDEFEKAGYYVMPGWADRDRIVNVGGALTGRIGSVDAGAKGRFYEWRRALEARAHKVVDLNALTKKDVQPVQWLIQDVTPCGSKVMLAGPSKGGKSWALAELAVAVATGGEWFGWRVRTSGPVLMVDFELAPEYFAARWLFTCERAGVEPHDMAQVRALFKKGDYRTLREIKGEIIDEAKALGAVLVVLDPVYKAMEGDENSIEGMREFFKVLDEIVSATGAAVCYSHHFAKGFSAQRSVIDRASGTGGFARDPDALITLNEIDVPEEEREDNSIALRVETALRYAPERTANVWFHRDARNRGAWHELDQGGTLAGLPLVGSPESNGRRGAAARAANAQGWHDEANRAVCDAIRAIEATGGVATVAGVLEYTRGATVDGAPLNRDRLNGWLRRGADWLAFEKADNGTLTARGAGDGR